MEKIKLILTVMAAILAKQAPEKILPLLPYQDDEMKQYFSEIAPNDTMGFLLLQLENYFYEHENAIERENKRVFEYWSDIWSYPLFEKTEPAFYTDEPELWQAFLDEMQRVIEQTKRLI